MNAPWMPQSAGMPPPPPGVPMTQRFTPENLAAKLPWSFLAFLAQSIGLLLIFVGGLLAVTGGVIPPGCFTSSCGTGTEANIGYAVMVARLLIVLGLFGLATGAGLHLQFRPALADGATAEQTRAYLARRRGEFLLLVLTILLTIAIVWWSVVPLAPPT
jgi:hypothetical protein